MKAKKDEPQDTGAPAALARWSAQEASDAGTVARLSKELDNLLRLDRDDNEIVSQINRAKSDLAAAKDQWHQTSKLLLSFDKGVASERREGEKVLVAEAKEIFAQYELSLRLAMEACILGLAQQAALCDSPEAFHIAAAPIIRATCDGAVDAAKRDGVLPAWLN